jgi:hypothetical protein
MSLPKIKGKTKAEVDRVHCQFNRIVFLHHLVLLTIAPKSLDAAGAKSKTKNPAVFTPATVSRGLDNSGGKNGHKSVRVVR